MALDITVCTPHDIATYCYNRLKSLEGQYYGTNTWIKPEDGASIMLMQEGVDAALLNYADDFRSYCDICGERVPAVLRTSANLQETDSVDICNNCIAELHAAALKANLLPNT
jgi:hypothetical protein